MQSNDRKTVREQMGWRSHILDAIVIVLLLFAIVAFGMCVFSSIWGTWYQVVWWLAVTILDVVCTFIGYCMIEVSFMPPDDENHI